MDCSSSRLTTESPVSQNLLGFSPKCLSRPVCSAFFHVIPLCLGLRYDLNSTSLGMVVLNHFSPVQGSSVTSEISASSMRNSSLPMTTLNHQMIGKKLQPPADENPVFFHSTCSSLPPGTVCKPLDGPLNN